ncbi:hypothetical protein EDB92DRAFT_1818653 [Lactarius akahatsu]|uniref:CHAT domain-containing protein n=1 Tax=Lactarius akahatsu TaxID=416441 RepID=A0AAD4QAX1_9AGAM|nr:hypothetical protein EDB92DRAFT_1818653 [Lactarius akahatsu]
MTPNCPSRQLNLHDLDPEEKEGRVTIGAIRNAIGLIQVLVVSRLNSYSRSEYLEDAIYHIRTLLCLPSLPYQEHTDLIDGLDNYERQRFSYFGVTGNSGESPSYGYHPYFVLQRPVPRQWGVGPEDDPVEKVNRLKEILTAVQLGKTTDVEAAAERSQTLLLLQHSNDRLSYFPAIVFADILFRAHLRMNKLNDLNEAILTYRAKPPQSVSPKSDPLSSGRGAPFHFHLVDAFVEAEELPSDRPSLKLVDINQRFESVMMSVAESESESMDSIGRLVPTQRRLLEERETLIPDIRSFPGSGDFLKPPSFDVLNSAAAHGPVIINQSKWRLDIIILHKDSPPSVISTPSSLHDRANRSRNQLLRAHKESGLDSRDYGLTLASVLSDLYKLVGKPVIDKLCQLEVPEYSRVWWCPTSAFCSTRWIDKPSLLLVAQPDTLPGAWEEIGAIQATKAQETTLISTTATLRNVIERLRDHQFSHFVCHGLLEIGKPFDASFELHGDRICVPFCLSHRGADQTQYCRRRAAPYGCDEILWIPQRRRDDVGHGRYGWADLPKHFYKLIFSDKASQKGVPYYEISARALQFAVKKLRRKRGITLECWVNFVHYGA